MERNTLKAYEAQEAAKRANPTPARMKNKRKCVLCDDEFTPEELYPDEETCSQECYDTLRSVISERRADPLGRFL